MPTQGNEKDEGDHTGQVLICRPFITVNGKRRYARDYGLKAFCFWVDDPNGKKAA